MIMLSKEQKLLLMLSPLSINEKENKEIQELANNKDFNWFEVTKYAVYHRTGLYAGRCTQKTKYGDDGKGVYDIPPSI